MADLRIVPSTPSNHVLTSQTPDPDMYGIPTELHGLRNHRVWGLFTYKPNPETGTASKQPIKVVVEDKQVFQSCNDQNTLFTYDEAQQYTITYAAYYERLVLVVSLPLASDLLNRTFSIIDLDVQKEKFNQDLLPKFLEAPTFIDRSPSGVGFHCWYTFSGRPPTMIKYEGVDNVRGFITLSCSVYNDVPIEHVVLPNVVSESTHGEPLDIHIPKSEQLSVVRAFNEQCENFGMGIEDLLTKNGYIDIRGKFLYPLSTTGNAGGVLYPSIKGSWKVLYSFHGDDPLATKAESNGIYDPFDVFRILECNNDRNTAVQKAGELCQPINHDTGEWIEGYKNLSGYNLRIHKNEKMNSGTVETYEESPEEEEEQQTYSQGITPLPESTFAPDDLYGSLVYSLLETQFVHNIAACHLTADAFISYAMGGIFCGKHNTDRINNYSVAVGGTGCGKEIIRTGPQYCINELINGGYISPHFAGGIVHNFGSVEAMEEKFIRLGDRPDILYTWDEMGIGLKEAASNSSSVFAKVMNKSLTLFTTSHSYMTKRELVGNDDEPVRIPAPHLFLIGGGTEASISESLTDDFVTHGNAARFLMYPVELYKKFNRNGGGHFTLDKQVCDSLASLFNAKGNNTTYDRMTNPIKFTWGHEVTEYLADISEWNYDLPNSALKDITNRRALYVKKKMMLRAAINGVHNIPLEYAQWADEIISHTIQYQLALSTSAMAVSPTDNVIKHVIARLQKGLDERKDDGWVRQRALLQSNPMRKLPVPSRVPLLEYLVTDYGTVERRETKNQRGRQTIWYRLIK